MRKIIVVRHGEKDGDKLTTKGAMQAFAVAITLGKIYMVDRIYHSGLNRAWQSAAIAAAALGIKTMPEVHEGLNFEATMNAIYNTDECRAEIKVIKVKGGTVGDALQVSEYARCGRVVMLEVVMDIAAELDDDEQEVALCFSHSPWLELAADPDTPYCIGECDAIIYTVFDGKISEITSELVRAPLEGKTN